MKNCIFCGNNDFSEALDLGRMYPSAFVLFDFNYDEAKDYETKLLKCNRCQFVQLSEFPERDELYRTYWYRSNLNQSMVWALGDIVTSVYERWPALKNGFASRVLDIASNDGTLLKFYPKHWYRVGVDPALNLRGNYSQDNCDLFVNDYFNSKLYFSRPFDIITSIAMFYDLTDPYDFVQGIKQNLSPDGIWVCQQTDLTCMLQANAWDSVVGEHCAYWTLRNFKELVEKFDLEIFDVEYNDVNGRSVRSYMSHKGVRKPQLAVGRALRDEATVAHPAALTDLDTRITDIGNKLFSLLNKLKAENKEVCGLGASTKGNTLLQTFGLNEAYISCIGEVSKEKLGLFTIGSHIPIVHEDDMFATGPDAVLVLCWHFIQGIVEKHKDYLDKGGIFIVPMPEPAIINKTGIHKL